MDSKCLSLLQRHQGLSVELEQFFVVVNVAALVYCAKGSVFKEERLIGDEVPRTAIRTNGGCPVCVTSSFNLYPFSFCQMVPLCRV